MHIKKILFSIVILLSSCASFAQDKIFKKNGEVIEAKVSVINTDVIIFKKFDNPDGPEYSIPKTDVIKIKYANGTEDIFGDDEDKIGVKSHNIPKNGDGSSFREKIAINNNIIAAAPLQVTENGFGMGLTWEHYLDKAGWVSFYLPAILTFNPTGYNTAGGAPEYTNLFYLMPGIKVYTNLNSPKRAKFSIGPSLVFAVGSGINNNYSNNYPYDQGVTQSRFLMGALVNFGFNYFTANHLYLGFDFGLGASYLNNYDGVNAGFSTLAQGSFRIGYRYHRGTKTAVTQN